MKSGLNKRANVSQGSLPLYDHSRSNSKFLRQPRPNPPPIKTIELMGINLHAAREVERDVDPADVTQMR